MTPQFLDKQNTFQKKPVFPKISGNCRQTSGSGGSFLPLKAFPGDRRFTLSPSRPLRGGLPPAETQFPYTP